MIYLAILLLIIGLFPDGTITTMNIFEWVSWLTCVLQVYPEEWRGWVVGYSRVHIASSLWENANSCFKGIVTVDVPSSTRESSCCCRSLPALSIKKLFYFCLSGMVILLLFCIILVHKHFPYDYKLFPSIICSNYTLFFAWLFSTLYNLPFSFPLDSFKLLRMRKHCNGQSL